MASVKNMTNKRGENMSNWESTLDEYGMMIEQRLSHFLKKECVDARTYHDFIGRV